MASFVKDPNDVLDYGRDYTAWLDGDTITGHEIIVTPASGLTVDTSSHTDTAVTVWLSGGVEGTEAQITYRITTAAGRTVDRTDRFIIRQR